MTMTAVLPPMGFTETPVPTDPTTHALLCSSKVPEIPVDQDQLRGLLEAAGLSTSSLPDTPPGDVRAFQSVCTGLATKRGRKDSKGEFVESTRIKSEPDECVYVITAGRKDPANRDLLHSNTMRVVFDKEEHKAKRDPIRVEPMGDVAAETLSEIEGTVRLQYEALRGKINGQKVRALFREEFRRLNATRWASNSSLWFVPLELKPRVDAMENVLKALYGNECEWDTEVIVRNNGKLIQKSGTHAINEATELLKDLDATLAASKVTKAAKIRILERRSQLVEYVATMEKLVGGEVAQLHVAIDMLNSKLVALMAKADGA